MVAPAPDVVTRDQARQLFETNAVEFLGEFFLETVALIEVSPDDEQMSATRAAYDRFGRQLISLSSDISDYGNGNRALNTLIPIIAGDDVAFFEVSSLSNLRRYLLSMLDIADTIADWGQKIGDDLGRKISVLANAYNLQELREDIVGALGPMYAGKKGATWATRIAEESQIPGTEPIAGTRAVTPPDIMGLTIAIGRSVAALVDHIGNNSSHRNYLNYAFIAEQVQAADLKNLGFMESWGAHFGGSALSPEDQARKIDEMATTLNFLADNLKLGGQARDHVEERASFDEARTSIRNALKIFEQIGTRGNLSALYQLRDQEQDRIHT